MEKVALGEIFLLVFPFPLVKCHFTDAAPDSLWISSGEDR